MDVLGPLPKTAQENKYLIVMADSFFGLAPVVLTATTSATQVANMFLNFWITRFGIPNYVLTDYFSHSKSCSLQPSADTYASNI